MTPLAWRFEIEQPQSLHFHYLFRLIRFPRNLRTSPWSSEREESWLCHPRPVRLIDVSGRDRTASRIAVLRKRGRRWKQRQKIGHTFLPPSGALEAIGILVTNEYGVSEVSEVGGGDRRICWIGASPTRRLKRPRLGRRSSVDHGPSIAVHDWYPCDAPDTFLRSTSETSAASSSAFIKKLASGRPSHDGDQHLEIMLQTSSASHSLELDGRAGLSPETTLYMITPSLAPGKGCCPVITWTLP